MALGIADFRLPSYRMTPLSWAANGGHEAVVKMLLERDDVKPDTADRYGETPLFKAGEEGHEGVVKMLLERGGVNLNAADDRGETILFRAASWGCEGIVKLLLEQVGVNSDIANLAGETALSRTLKHGHYAIVKLLSEHKNTIPPLDGDEFSVLSSPEESDLDKLPSETIGPDFKAKAQNVPPSLGFPSDQPQTSC